MNVYEQIINELSDEQANWVLSVVAKSLNDSIVDKISLADGERLADDSFTILSKPILRVLTEGNDETAIALRQQLLANRDFLDGQRNQGETRSISLSMLPILAIVIPFIETKFELKLSGKDRSLHFVARVKSLSEVLAALNYMKIPPDFLFDELKELPVSSSLEQEIKMLIKNGKTSESIEALMEYFDPINEEAYMGLLILSNRFEHLKSSKLKGTISQEDLHLESNKIVAAIVSYLRLVKEDSQ